MRILEEVDIGRMDRVVEMVLRGDERTKRCEIQRPEKVCERADEQRGDQACPPPSNGSREWGRRAIFPDVHRRSRALAHRLPGAKWPPKITRYPAAVRTKSELLATGKTKAGRALDAELQRRRREERSAYC